MYISYVCHTHMYTMNIKFTVCFFISEAGINTSISISALAHRNY